MTYNLTPKQKAMLRELVSLIKAGEVDEEFYILWDGNAATGHRAMLYGQQPNKYFPAATPSGIEALVENELLSCQNSPSSRQLYAITGKAYEAIESDFATTGAPPTYDFKGARFAGGFAGTVQGNQTGGIFNNQSAGTLSFDDMNAEILGMLKQLKASNPDATESDQTAFLNAMIPPTCRERFISAMQSAGSAAIDEVPYGSVLKALVNGWRNPS